ncbi:hemerythrin domain-containing protein [Aquirhabdus sp.]|uniref:hemerythrin domain-containing protein n=1 Tax=Aquirhabdus sp. TaxID=2824160 RepID=UPI00396C5698
MNTQVIVPPSNAIDLLTIDHRKLSELFTDYLELGEGDSRLKEKFANFLSRDLLKYMIIQENVFFPFILSKIKRGQDLVDEAIVAHVGFKELIAKLQHMGADDELFDATVKVLSQRFDVYVDDMESCFFPLLKRSEIDLDELGVRMRQGAEKVD